MYKVLIDNTELVNAPLDLDSLTIEVIREDGFENTSQILREKTETELTFYGDGYKAIADELKVSNCTVFDFEIQKECNDIYTSLFTGKLKSSDVEVDVTKCLIKSAIRDASFTGLVKDYLNVDLPLYYSKTKNCLPLERIDRLIDVGFNKSLAFDVLDVLNYQIKYFTDNKSYVVSDYLTANKYIITTGYNLHNPNGALSDKYPNISFNKLFLELRKKFRLYIVVEYALGVPYLRIEPESYSFSDVELLSIDKIPNGTTELIDINRIFNAIEVGSNDTELDTGEDFYNINIPLYNWNKTTFTACGECSVSNYSEQSKLDLVSDFIIDSDIISELLSLGEGVASNNNTKIVLINYETVSGNDVAIMNFCNGIGIFFNCTLTNYNVIQNWLGYSPQCLAISRYSVDYFKIENNNYLTKILGASFQDIGYDVVEFANEIADNNSTINIAVSQSIKTTRLLPYPLSPTTATGTATFSYYKCSKTGNYNLITELINITQTSTPSFSGIPLLYILHINHYSDDTFSTIINQYTQSILTPEFSDIVTLTNETGVIPINAGECVVVDFEFGYDSGSYIFISTDIDFTAEKFNFFQKEDNSVCENFDNELQDSKARMINFKYPLCFEDFLFIKNNKRGYISVENKKFWIKSLKYNPQKESEFQLIGNNSIIK